MEHIFHSFPYAIIKKVFYGKFDYLIDALEFFVLMNKTKVGN
jgi:hypothetical protein